MTMLDLLRDHVVVSITAFSAGTSSLTLTIDNFSLIISLLEPNLYCM